MDNTTIITLNLRGKKFQTLKSTFDKFDFSQVDITKTGDNEYFIDKDPTHFYIILEHAKSGKPMRSAPHGYQHTSVHAAYGGPNPQQEASSYGLCTCDVDRGYFSETCQKHNAELAEHMKTCTNGYNHTHGGYALCRWWSKK